MGDGGKRKVSQPLFSLSSACVKIMKYHHKQETNPDALSRCWDNLSLGSPPGKADSQAAASVSPITFCKTAQHEKEKVHDYTLPTF